MSCDNMTKENNLMKSAYVAFGQNKTLTLCEIFLDVLLLERE